MVTIIMHIETNNHLQTGLNSGGAKWKTIPYSYFCRELCQSYLLLVFILYFYVYESGLCFFFCSLKLILYLYLVHTVYYRKKYIKSLPYNDVSMFIIACLYFWCHIERLGIFKFWKQISTWKNIWVKVNLIEWIRVITKLPNSEQSYKGKVKTHKYINRQNQSTTGKLWKP